MSKARLQKKLQERQDQANARLDEYYTLYNSIRGKTIIIRILMVLSEL